MIRNKSVPNICKAKNMSYDCKNEAETSGVDNEYCARRESPQESNYS
jgi:hypothetical protein